MVLYFFITLGMRSWHETFGYVNLNWYKIDSMKKFLLFFY